jgi:hypothetical protein
MGRPGRLALFSAWSLALPGFSGAAGEEKHGGGDAPGRQCAIIVTGAPGAEEYGADFARAAAAWEDAARGGGAEVIRIGPGGSEEGAGGAGSSADRDILAEAIRGRARGSKECLWIVLIGHGTFDGRAAKFNLRGPDFAAEELAEWLKPCDRPLAVIHCGSASGPFLNRLSGPGRAIVTATRSGDEINYARFGRCLGEAISSGDGDLDKDEQVSLLEAFLLAAARTAEFYEREARLATEHALIDDNGDGLGTPADWFRGTRAVRRAAGGAAADGLRSSQIVLVRRPVERAMPASVREERDRLEQALESLREEKAKLDPAAYYARLEPILLELARLYERFEKADEAPPPAPGEGAAGAKED